MSKLIAFCLLMFLFAQLYAAPASFREDFARAGKNGVPQGWKTEGFKWGVPKTVCSIQKDSSDNEDKTVLQIKCDKSTGGIIFDAKAIDLTKTPVMRWRWRVLSYPVNGDGRNPKTDDQPVAVYVGMADGMVSKKSVAYRWEYLTPKGYEGMTTYAKILSVHFITLRDRTTPVGEWVTESRNVAEDFQRIYGVVPKAFALSIIGNSQYTRSNTIAEVDYIEFVPAESPAQK